MRRACSCLPFSVEAFEDLTMDHERQREWTRGQLKPWVLLVSQTTFFHLQNILWETPDPVPQALWKKEGREITGSLRTYWNKGEKKEKKRWKSFTVWSLGICHAVPYGLGCLMDACGRSHGIYSDKSQSWESKEVAPVLLFLLEASHPTAWSITLQPARRLPNSNAHQTPNQTLA